MTLLEYKEAEGLSWRGLADRVGVDAGSLCAWARGRRAPGPASASKLADLGIDVRPLVSPPLRDLLERVE